MLRAKVCPRAPRLSVRKRGGLLALLLCLIRLGSLKRGRRSDGGAVARKTRPTIHWHGHRSLDAGVPEGHPQVAGRDDLAGT